MAKQTKDERIKELEKRVKDIQEYADMVVKRNQELVAAEEGTFLHSPTYLQLNEKIEFIEACRALDEVEIARLRTRIPTVENTVRNIYEDNKKFIENLSDEMCSEYFVGLSQNWHEAWEYRKLSDENMTIRGINEQLKFSLAQRDKEIERLQMLLAEERVEKVAQKEEHKEEMATQENNPRVIRMRGGRR